MSEHLAPDPKPSCCLSSPMGTCEQHATFSEAELRIMELEQRASAAIFRLTRGPIQYLDPRALAAAIDDAIAILEGR